MVVDRGLRGLDQSRYYPDASIVQYSAELIEPDEPNVGENRQKSSTSEIETELISLVQAEYRERAKELVQLIKRIGRTRYPASDVSNSLVENNRILS